MSKVSPRKTKEEQRRYNMSRIRSKNTKIEVIFRKALWHQGIRYRINYKELPGKPDIAITKYKIAIFCDGEFWHGKDWKDKKEKIRENSSYWIPKIEKNMHRDNEINAYLKSQGWHVLRFWGNDVKKNVDSCIIEVKNTIMKIDLHS